MDHKKQDDKHDEKHDDKHDDKHAGQPQHGGMHDASKPPMKSGGAAPAEQGGAKPSTGNAGQSGHGGGQGSGTQGSHTPNKPVETGADKPGAHKGTDGSDAGSKSPASTHKH